MNTPRNLLSRLVGSAFAVFLAAVPAVPAGVNTWTGGDPAKGPDANAGLIATDPRDPYVVYAVFQPSVYKSRDGGRTWTRLASFVRIHSLLVHPAAPDTLYMGVWAGLTGEIEGVAKSSDGGLTWSVGQLEPNVYWGAPRALAGSPTDENVVYAGAWSVLFTTTDGGNSWTRTTNLTTHLSSVISRLVVSPRNPQVVYAGGQSDFYYYPFGAFARSLNGGGGWERGNLGPLDAVSAIAADPAAESRVFVGLSGDPAQVETGIRRSEDGGSNFVRADQGLPTGESVLSLVIDPANPSTLYAGTQSGVYRSRNFGVDWYPFGQLLAGLGADSLAISADGRQLHASTSRNAYHMDLVSGPVDLTATPGGGARILRWESDRVAIQTVDGSNNWSVTPFSATTQTWTGIAIASARDGQARTLWQNGDGRSALQIVGAGGGESVLVLSGDSTWLPTDVAVGADGRTRLLFADATGAMHVATVRADGFVSRGPQYGPTPGWTAIAIDAAPDGRTWVLWRSADGRVAVSVHVDGTIVTTVKWGATDGWWVEDLGVGSDGRARVLARNVAGAMQVWTVGDDGSLGIGSTHESPGLVPRRIAAGADGLTRVLGGGEHGTGAIWLFDGNGTLVSTHDIPVPPVSVAADWSGTFDSIDFFDCELGVQASATFTQQGSTVEGVLNAEESGCAAIGVTFHGTLSEDQIHRTILHGTITGGTGVYEFSPGSTATGVLSGTTLDLVLFENSPSPLRSRVARCGSIVDRAAHGDSRGINSAGHFHGAHRAGFGSRGIGHRRRVCAQRTSCAEEAPMTRSRIRVSGSVLATVLTVASAVQAGVNTWSGSRPSSAGLVAMDPLDPYVVYAAGPDLYKSRDGGRTWTRIASLPYISALLVHPAAPDTLYLGGQNDADFGVVFKSSDAGDTWTSIPLSTNPWSFAGDPRDASIVYAGMDYLTSSVDKTSDGGASWSSGSSLVGTIVSLALDPSNPDVVYAGTDTSSFPGSSSAVLARSQDGGGTWSQLVPGSIESVSAIAIDPADPSKLYIGLAARYLEAERGIRRSEDGGITFSREVDGLRHDANVWSLVIDPANPSTLYAGTDSGVYRSRDSGSHWAAVGQILSGSRIYSLVISPDGRRIHAGTASGPFHMDLVSGPVDLAAAPGGGARLLRWNGDRSAVQTVDGANNWTATPFSATSETWSAIAITSASDGPARALWQNGDGRSAVETVGGAVSVFKPSMNGVPADVAMGVDGTIVLLSTTVSGLMHLETISTDGSVRSALAYGAPGWSAVAVDMDAEGRAWVLWRSVDGRGAVSVHVDGTLVTTVGWGATEGWWVEDLGVGSDGRARVLARNAAGAMQVWTVGEDGSRIVGATHESPGLVPRRIAAGADGLTRVLWGGDHGEGTVWFLTDSGNFVAVEVPVLP